MKTFKLTGLACGLGLAMCAGGVSAHDIDEAGEPVCIEANYMMADAQNLPFASANGPGRVIEMNIFTGTPGITVANPFIGRDGTPIRTVSYKELLGNPAGFDGYGTVPRPLGTQLMPNGNLIQAICDANFFNASNSDDDGAGGLEANHYFPPVNSTDARASNSRLLVIDQSTMEVIDEYSRPEKGQPGHGLWGCAAGIMFDDTGMWISTFHGAAVLRIDWKAGLQNSSTGVGSNSPGTFKLDRGSNHAVVTEVVDFRLGEPADSGWRRDSLRAISFDESGNIYATDRERSEECLRDAAGCNPSVFRQRVNIASLDGYNDPSKRRTLALDPGVNVIAGIRTNRMSGPGCDFVKANALTYATYLNDGTPANPKGYALEEDLCDVETLLVAASAMNPGCDPDGNGLNGPGHPANQCFKPGGSVAEYIIHPNFTDGGAAYGGDKCTGDPADEIVGGDNAGCAQPIAMFDYTSPDDGAVQKVDPRMLMVIHEAFGQ
jgi:hypothetical protein